jgi:hypothetical protein
VSGEGFAAGCDEAKIRLADDHICGAAHRRLLYAKPDCLVAELTAGAEFQFRLGYWISSQEQT